MSQNKQSWKNEITSLKQQLKLASEKLGEAELFSNNDVRWRNESYSIKLEIKELKFKLEDAEFEFSA